MKAENEQADISQRVGKGKIAAGVVELIDIP